MHPHSGCTAHVRLRGTASGRATSNVAPGARPATPVQVREHGRGAEAGADRGDRPGLVGGRRRRAAARRCVGHDGVRVACGAGRGSAGTGRRRARRTGPTTVSASRTTTPRWAIAAGDEDRAAPGVRHPVLDEDHDVRRAGPTPVDTCGATSRSSRAATCSRTEPASAHRYPHDADVGRAHRPLVVHAAAVPTPAAASPTAMPSPVGPSPRTATTRSARARTTPAPSPSARSRDHTSASTAAGPRRTAAGGPRVGEPRLDQHVDERAHPVRVDVASRHETRDLGQVRARVDGLEQVRLGGGEVGQADGPARVGAHLDLGGGASQHPQPGTQSHGAPFRTRASLWQRRPVPRVRVVHRPGHAEGHRPDGRCPRAKRVMLRPCRGCG